MPDGFGRGGGGVPRGKVVEISKQESNLNAGVLPAWTNAP